MMLFGVMFSSNIVTYMTKSKNSEFENVKFSVRNSEMIFDNFVVNGKSLGKGRATVGIVQSGLFNLVPKLTLSNLKLDDVNLESIYKEKNSQIDTFTDKINSLTTQEKADKSTADFIKETTTKVTTLTTNTDNFINKLRSTNRKILNSICEIETKDYIEQFVLFPTFSISKKNGTLTVKINQDYAYLLNDFSNFPISSSLSITICLIPKSIAISSSSYVLLFPCI